MKWMAPEALHNRISNEKTDVVSLLLCRAEPALKCIMIYHTVGKFGKLTLFEHLAKESLVN